MNESEKMYIDELIAQGRYYEAGKEYLSLGNYDEAKQCFEEYKEVEDKDWTELGYKFLENNKIEDAIECFDNGFEFGETLVGKYFLEKGDYNSAKQYFDKALIVEDEDWIKLGVYFIQEDNPEEALECFESVHYHLEDDYWRILGDCFLKNKDESKALYCFEYLEEAPYFIAKYFIDNYTIDNDEKIRENIQKINPECIDKSDLNYLFRLYLDKTKDMQNDIFANNFEYIIEHLSNKAHERDVKCNLYFILVKFYLKNNNANNKIKKFLKICEDLAYEDYNFYFEIGKYYLKNDYYKAKEYFNKAIELLECNRCQKNQQTYFMQILMSLKIKKYDIAYKYIKKC